MIKIRLRANQNCYLSCFRRDLVLAPKPTVRLQGAVRRRNDGCPISPHDEGPADRTRTALEPSCSDSHQYNPWSDHRQREEFLAAVRTRNWPRNPLRQLVCALPSRTTAHAQGSICVRERAVVNLLTKTLRTPADRCWCCSLTTATRPQRREQTVEPMDKRLT